MIDRKKIAEKLREIASFYAPDDGCTNAIYDALTDIANELDPPEPKPLLADAHVGDIVKTNLGDWLQIVDTPCLRFGHDECHRTHDGLYWDECGVCDVDSTYRLVAVEPLATEGTAEWAWQMLMLQKPVSHPAEGEFQDTYYTKEGFVRCMAKTGWQLYEEPGPPKEPDYITCKRCGGSKSVPNPAVSNTAYTTCPKCGGTGYEIDEQKKEPKLPKEQKIDLGEKEYTCLICRKKMSGLDGRAEVSIKRFSISNLYESTLSHYCGSCFLKLGFDATEKELRSRQQPNPAPAFKVRDWVEFNPGNNPKQVEIVQIDGDKLYYNTMYAGKTIKTHIYASAITRKLDPSEVIVKIGCLKGTVAHSSSSHFCLCAEDNWTMIAFDMLDTPTRELVESLLKAQEEK